MSMDHPFVMFKQWSDHVPLALGENGRLRIISKPHAEIRSPPQAQVPMACHGWMGELSSCLSASDRDTGEKACFRTPCRVLWSAGQEPGGAASEGRVALTLNASPRVKQVLWAGHPGVPLHRAEAFRGLSVHNGGKLQQWTLTLRGLIPGSCWEAIYAFKRPRLSLASPSTLILTAFPSVLK